MKMIAKRRKKERLLIASLLIGARQPTRPVQAILIALLARQVGENVDVCLPYDYEHVYSSNGTC